MRIAYLIPEFPGQTHAFFMRERAALQDMGVPVGFVSTRRPEAHIISHSWAREAMQETDYLFPLGARVWAGAIGEILRAGPGSWWTVFRALMRSECVSVRDRIRLVALIPLGAALAWLARRRSWDHIHVHSCADSAHIAMFAHLLSGLSYSLTLHGPLHDYGRNHREKWRYVRFAIVITQRLLKEVQEQLAGVLPSRIAIAPMGVDIDRFARAQAYEPWQGSGPARIVSCARLHRAKGHDHLIQAIGLLRRRGIDARLEIAGEDNTGGEQRRELELLIEELGLGEHVELLGAISEEEVRKRLESAHVFALASLAEPLGVAIMEAMAMQMPVVATRAGGVPELVDSEEDGLLVEPRQPDPLADAIESLLRDPDRASGLGAAGRAKVERSFSSRRSAEVLAECLRIDSAS